MLRHLQQANPSATLRGGKASTHNERSYHTSTHASNPLHVFYYLQELTPSLFLRLISLLCLKTMKPKANIVVGIISGCALSTSTLAIPLESTFQGLSLAPGASNSQVPWTEASGQKSYQINAPLDQQYSASD